MMESNIPLIKETAILATRISMRTLAFASSTEDKPAPKICRGKKDSAVPHRAASAARMQNRVKNIPLRVANLSRS